MRGHTFSRFFALNSSATRSEIPNVGLSRRIELAFAATHPPVLREVTLASLLVSS